MTGRLTKRRQDGRVGFAVSGTPSENMCKFPIVLDKLGEYEDLEEDGRLIRLPCKVGDTVWKIEDIWHLDDKETWTYHYEKEVVEFMIRNISISCNSKGKWTKKFRICEVRNGKVIDHQRDIEFEDFGKIVFPIREDADKALADIF